MKLIEAKTEPTYTITLTQKELAAIHQLFGEQTSHSFKKLDIDPDLGTKLYDEANEILFGSL